VLPFLHTITFYHIAASEKASTSIYLAPLLECRKASGINLRKCGSFSYWFDNLGFTTEGRLTVVLIIPSSWGSQRDVIYTPSSIFFLALLPGRKKISVRGVSHAQFFTLFLFCFISFLLASFLSKIQKNSSFDSLHSFTFTLSSLCCSLSMLWMTLQ
jgi:hypothetical protein